MPQPELKADAELDSDSYPGEADNDNNHVFGPRASVRDTQATTTLVRRYYAAAAAEDGALACRLMYSPIAESIAEDYGPAPGSGGATGETCAAAAARLFAQRHSQLETKRAALKVVAVRVRGRELAVTLRFGASRQLGYLELHRERGAWKVDDLLDSEQALYVE